MSDPTPPALPPPPQQSVPHRKRLRRREIDYTPRYLTFSCYQRLQLFATPALKQIFVDALRRAHGKGDFELIAWIIMPEHIHLMVRPMPGVIWAPVAAGLKTSVSKRILNRWQRTGDPVLSQLHDARPRGDLHFWQPGGGFDRNVRDDAELEKEIRYIYHNPVERELVAEPTDWEWSSARFWTARHERYRGTREWSQSRDEPDGWDAWWKDENGLACDWPPGDWRAWAMWPGFQ